MKNLLLLFIPLLWMGCTSTKTTNSQAEMNSSEIENVKWSLMQFDGKSVPASVDGKVTILLSKDGNNLSGSTGCNQLMGSYEIQNGLQLSFSAIGTTRMACPTPGWDEVEFTQMLETVNNYTLDGNQLSLNVGKRAPLAVFSKIPEDGVTNKYWKLKTLEGKPVAMAENQEREQYFILREDNVLTGFAGCNQFSGNFKAEQDQQRIKFSNMLTTLRACPDVSVDEAGFLGIFELVDNYTIDGDTLSLNVGRRAPLAVFEAVYF